MTNLIALHIFEKAITLVALKIIFLDFDGVLNVTKQGRDEYGALFHLHFANNLNRIVKATKAKIVITSTWRDDGLNAMQKMWKHRKLDGEIIGVTPILHLQNKSDRIKGYVLPRGLEIDCWLNTEGKNYEIENYVILDDDVVMLLTQKENFIRCSGNSDDKECDGAGFGLTNKCADKAIEILNRVKKNKSKK